MSRPKKPEGTKMICTTVLLSPEQLALVRQIAGREYLKNARTESGRPSASAIVRRALEAYLEART